MCIWFLLLLLIFYQARGQDTAANETILCRPNLSIAVSPQESQLLANGSLHHAGRVYPPEHHFLSTSVADNSSRRVCPCAASQSQQQPRPCLRKCCPDGQLLEAQVEREEPCTEASEIGWLPLPQPQRLHADFIGAIERERAEFAHDWFQLVGWAPRCDDSRYGFYELRPSEYPEDAWQLDAEGWLRLTADSRLYGPGEFCLDRQLDNDDRLAVLVCVELEPSGDGTSEEADDDENPHDKITRIGCIFSVPFLLATMLVYLIIPELQNIYGRTLMCYVAALLGAYSFLFVTEFLHFGTACHITAYIVHFFFLASFFWLNVMCFDIWWTFGGFRSLHGSVKQREHKKFMMYSIYAWGCASLLTGLCLIMDLTPGIPNDIIKPNFGQQTCWFASNDAKAIYFYGPMGVTVICNIFLFIMTAIKILRHKKDTARHLKGSDSRRHDDNKQWFNLYLKLFIVMGINWSMEIVSWLLAKRTPEYIFYLTDLVNSLQGVVIFIIFVWKEKIKQLLLKRFGCEGKWLSRNSTGQSGNPQMTNSSSRNTCTTMTTVPVPEKSVHEKISPVIETTENV